MFGRKRKPSDFAAEIEAHLELETERLRGEGLSDEEARGAARRAFGNVTRAQERSYESRRWLWWDHLAQDLRFGLRMLAKNPGFTTVGVLTLALGIGATVAIFAFVDAVLLKPLPYRDAGRLVGVTESVAMIPRANLSYPDYLDWKRLNKVFCSLDVWVGTGYLLRTPSGTLPISAARVSDGFFRTLGVAPVLGRDFYPGEDLPSAPHTVMLSFAAWQKWFGAKKDVIGQGVTLSGVSYTIIGVLPREFQFAPRGDAEFWTTLHPSGPCDERRSCHSLDGIGRLKDGVSVETALADMKTIALQLERQYPDSNRGQGASVMPLRKVLDREARPILLVLLSAAGLLLLIACVNVTSLLLVRTEIRKREISVRGALGASKARLVRQFTTEGLVLVALGVLLGLTSAHWAVHLIGGLIPADMMARMPYLEGLGLGFRGVVFTGAISLLAAVLFAATPARRLSLSRLHEGLAEGGRGSAGTLWRHFGANLVVVELAIAVVLLVGAGLLGKSFYRLLHVKLGFRPDHLATLQVAAPETNYGKEEQAARLGREIVNRIAALPGVESVGISNVLPVSFNGNTTWIRIVGHPYNGEHNEVNLRDVSAGFFATIQAKLLRGRYFTDAEDASKPRVVIINRELARQYFPGEDPIGKKIGDTSLSPESICEVIGVVEDVKDGSLDSEVWPAVYHPFGQNPDTFFSVVVRTAQPPQSVLATLVNAIHQIDPDLGTLGEATMEARIDDSPAAYLHRSSAWLVGGFATLALLLGVIGLYGVVAYSVSQRTREIGVRMALGAERRSVYQLILGEAAWLAGIGIALGLVGSVAPVTLMRGLLFGTEGWDLPTLSAVVAVLAIAALLASYIPARRATKVDPMVALRYE